jgi:two-component system sensor kinase FixL
VATDGQTKAEAGAESVAILAPATESRQIRSLLAAAGMEGLVATLTDLADRIRSMDICAAIVDEASMSEDLELQLRAALADQPPWSNFPIVLLVDRSTTSRCAHLIERLGNVGVVERPLDPSILIPSVRAALRSRRRQREAEAYLHQRQEAEARLQQLMESLEGRVRARTADLRDANARLLREIDERRRAEERLRESEELHRFTVELGQQLVWTASPEGRLLSLNRRFSELTGLDRKSDPHEGWLSVIHPDDYENTVRVFRDTVRSGEPGMTEFRMRLADGSYRMFLARAAPRRDADGKIVLWYGYTQDVEDQRQAKAAWLSAEERYRLAARATNDAIWDLDLAQGKIHWSDSAAEALGYPARRLGTTSIAWWEERIHPEDRRQALDSLEKAVSRGKTRWSATYRFRQASGEYATFFDRGFIVRGEDGEPTRFVGAMTDLTERERAQEEIRRMQAELIHVSRLSAMGTMASTLAHELNQPLTAVTNYVRGSRRLLAAEGDKRIGDVSGALELAEAGALRAGQIVRRLRELVARGTAAMRPEDLPKLIEDAGAIAFLDADYLGVAHKVVLDPEAQWVQVDRIQVQQVLINLIRNAIQAMQGVEAREVVVATKKVSPEQVEVSVADTGAGISPEVRDALFSAFQGTKPEGMGIGLSISRTIVEAHGGKIWAEDREGGGSVFRFTLPAWEELDAAEEEA